MSELKEKVKKSIERLKSFCPEEGYYLAFSGGKDSVVCKALLDMSGCKYDATYRVTTVDPPELVRFIKEKHPDVKRDVPRYPDNYKNEKLAGKPITMWNLIPEKMMPPTRIARYCCEKLKESGGDGRMTVTGVRWAESDNRKKNQGLVTILKKVSEKNTPEGFRRSPKHGTLILVNDNDESRRMVEQCFRRHTTTVNPIIDWKDSDVWEFIHAESIPYCELYNEGFTRLGCIGCPLTSLRERERELARWSKYKESYLKSFDRMLAERIRRNRRTERWMTSTDVMNWWLQNDVLMGQMNWFEDFEEEDDD